MPRKTVFLTYGLVSKLEQYMFVRESLCYFNWQRGSEQQTETVPAVFRSRQ